ncbi:MAG TPA: cytochrome c oxidase subunit II [Humisphaera sp.]
MNHGFSLFPKGASTLAPRVDALYFFMLAVTAFFTLLVIGLIVFFAVKYRRREDAPPPEKFENAKLELLWTVVPLLITVVMFVWGAKVFIAQSRIPENAIEVHVIGKQWMWHTQQPNGRREINALTVPVGRPVKLVMSSEDVIHSFYIPAFRQKQDVVPGRYSYMWFEPTEPGEYHLFCAEYCGTQHSGMIGTIRVLPADQYASWLKDTPSGTEPPEVIGAQLFASMGCIGCHSEQGPSMAGLYGRKDREVLIPTTGERVKVPADDAYLRESILLSKAKVAIDPQGNPYRNDLMPTYQGNGSMTEEKLGYLIAYIKSLGVNGSLPGNIMNPGNRAIESNPQPPYLNSFNSDPSRR